MKYSQLLIPTVKEVPAEAEIASHQLMIRAGFIRKVASGTYTYLPLGWKILRKIMEIVRQEMNAAGAQEILMPILQPMELWQRTGRDVDYGPTMFKLGDRKDAWNVLAPTAEEVVTSMMAGEINSYKQLPVCLYQISPKFRDELRPRFGVLRSREFLMKDAYSFHADLPSLEETYKKMYDAYCRVFTRCGLAYVIVEAESGPIGGSASHEFMVPCQAGEDIIVHTEDGTYAANIEKAEVDPPPVDPGLAAARAAVREPVEVHTPNVGSIEAVCEFMSTKPRKMIKTLIYWHPNQELLAEYKKHGDRLKNALAKLAGTKFVDSVTISDDPQKEGTLSLQVLSNLAANDESIKHRFTAIQNELSIFIKADADLLNCAYVALVRGDHEVNHAKLERIVGKALELAPEPVVKAASQASIGFAGPVGLRIGSMSKLLIDPAVAAMTSGVTGANKTNYHVKNIVPGRDFPLPPGHACADLGLAPGDKEVVADYVIVADIRNAAEGDTHGGKPLTFSRGIEIGHVFKLGTKYSDKLGAIFQDETGAKKPCIMGCYGIGVNRILASTIESDKGHDVNGCILPPAIAPFEVEIVPINYENAEIAAEVNRIYGELSTAGLDVLLDDRDERAGVKFKDADLLGIPLRIVVGEKGLKEGKVEFKRRTDAKATLVPAAEVVALVSQVLNEMTK